MNNETNETNETNEKILQLQAEREADRILHQLRMRKLHEPQSRDDQAQKESRGREVFSVVCRKNNLSGCEANFRVLFDADLLDSEYAATQAITSGAVQLAEASPQEAAKFREERIEARNSELLSLPPDQLRARVRQEATDSRAATVQAEADERFQREQQAQKPLGFPDLPSHFNGQTLDRAFLIKASKETLRFLISKFGTANINARIAGREN